MAEFYKYTHTDSSVTGLQEILTNPLFIPSGYSKLLEKNDISYVVKQFLDYTPDSTIPKNADILQDHLLRNGDKDTTVATESDPPLLPGVTFNIPYEYANLEIVAAKGINLESTERTYKFFIAERIKQIITDPKYVPAYKYGKMAGQIVTESYPQIEVWMWIRSIDKIINVSTFVENLVTNVNKSGGAFSFSLAPINNLPSEGYVNKSKHVVNEANMFTGSLNERNQFYFHKYVSANDLVFIKFEQLQTEEIDRDEVPLFIDKTKLSNQIYDMIGLVDSNSISVNPESNDVKITITGRDLSKLFIEDGSYFIPISYINGVTSFFTTIVENKDKFFTRNFLPDEYGRKFMFANIYRDITTTMQFYINYCSSIGIVPDELLSSYSEKASSKFKLTKEGKLETNPEPADGLWKIIKLCVDEQLSNRRIADFSISQPDGTMQSQFEKVCQEPFVEYFTDTYGDEFNIIVRQPPFTKEAIISLLDNDIAVNDTVKYESNESKSENSDQEEENSKPQSAIIEIDNEDILSETLLFNEDDIYTFFQIDSGYINFSGNSENILPFIPVCYFPEYVDIWGNRKFQISDIYTTFETIKDKNFSDKREIEKLKAAGREAEITKGIDYSYLVNAIVNDLKLCIDTYMYMPFVRKGTININGDRRIKRGMWIRHKGTNEIYYVDEVTQSFSIGDSIDRYTTLKVSRGMVEKYVKGFYEDVREDETVLISYFDIIDTQEIAKNIIDVFLGNKKEEQAVKSKFSVNKDIFDFFLKRKQFESND